MINDGPDRMKMIWSTFPVTEGSGIIWKEACPSTLYISRAAYCAEIRCIWWSRSAWLQKYRGRNPGLHCLS
ncbi:hypothetical protein ADH70_010430 [Blautia pseudococcoides]|uniref:Uncharacterized protein n=1 Tax=Blautia pseudococcoides TaxID=1796616 RepID=A0A1C7I9W0_9FIRM|nr:hypothetical protein A4V09_11965 [Blautia pseudococcoides]ASU29229.1 hypothetical protein ADH70_010430 [Blautia pseudococcoides]